MAENIPNMGKETDISIQGAQRVPKESSPKRSTGTHIIVKVSKVKDKERILKAVRGKQVATYKETPIRL